MKSQENELTSAQRETDRQALAWVAIIGGTSCLLIIVAGLLLWLAATSVTTTRIPIPSSTPTRTPYPTPTPKPNATRTRTPQPSATSISDLTPSPQSMLLRGACGQDHFARAGEPIELFYGGWGVLGFDLAQQWANELTVELTIDGLQVEGQQQPPSPDLPLNCMPERDDVYFLYYRVVLPELDTGTHNVTVALHTQKLLSDGSAIFAPGQIANQTFRITVR